MPKADAHAFYEKTLEDPTLHAAVRATREALIHLAKTHGFHFTYEELGEALAERWGADFEKDNPNPDEPQTCSCF